MKTLLKIIYFSLFVILFLGSEAQELHNPWIKLTTESNSLNYKLPGKRHYIRSSFIGSEYLTDNWCNGTVLLKNGDQYENLILKLNTYHDELIEYNERVGGTIMLDKSAISEFILNFEDGHTEQFRKIFYDRFPKGDRYFSIIHEGKLTVLLWYKTEETSTSMYADVRGIMHSSKYVLTKNYYLISPDHEMEKFRPKRRSFLALFPKQKKQVRRIIRKNHISFDNDSEISRAVSLIEKEI